VFAGAALVIGAITPGFGRGRACANGRISSGDGLNRGIGMGRAPRLTVTFEASGGGSAAHTGAAQHATATNARTELTRMFATIQDQAQNFTPSEAT
jgi:hypothetical protein